MKKNLLALAVSSLVSLGAMAQGYYYIKTKGVNTAEYDIMSTTGTSVIAATASPGTIHTLSAVQTLPFTWNFFGQPVSTFKVSSSGYLTFDTNVSTDDGANVALPSASAPGNAIFAFWDDLRIQTMTSSLPQGVRSWTYGTAPNRVFVVQWQFVQRNDNSTTVTNANFFAIRFYENGGNKFDLVQSFGIGTFTATMGVQNAAKDAAVSIAGSPNLNFGGSNNSYDATASDVYTFYYGTQPAIDLRLMSDLTADIVSASNTTGTPVSVQVSNYGSNSIASGTFNYSVNGGTPVSTTFNTTLPPSGGSAALSSTTNFVGQAADAGTFKNIQVWITGINGGSVGSDTLNTTIFVNKGVAGSKRVFVEEGSGAWCGYCPDGHYRLSEILGGTDGDKVVGVVHHNSDGMTNTNSNTINSAFATGYPYGVVDRVTFSDQTEAGLNRGIWSTKVAERLNTPTPVNVSIVERTYNASTRTVSFKVQANFVDYAAGDLRLNAYIIENNVRGPKISATSTTWNQRNYFAEGAATNSPVLPTLPSYIVGYKHQHTVRAIPSGAWGTSAVIPSVAAENGVYSQTYSYTVPAETSVTYDAADGNVNEELRNTISGPAMNKHYDMYIVGFVSIYNADLKKHEVLNVIEVPLAWNVGVNEKAASQTMPATVYPNPTSGLTSVSFTTSSTGNVEVTLVDITGKKVMDINTGSYAKGEHTVYFDATSLNNGIYFVSIKGDNETATKRLVIAK